MCAGWLLLQAPVLQAAARPLPGGYGVALVQSLLALVAVCILAWVVLRWSAKAGLGVGRGEHLEVVERMALDARRSVVVVRVGKRLLLLGVGEQAAPSLIAELDPEELPRRESPKLSFLEVLRKRSVPSSAVPPNDTPPNDTDEERGAA